MRVEEQDTGELKIDCCKRIQTTVPADRHLEIERERERERERYRWRWKDRKRKIEEREREGERMRRESREKRDREKRGLMLAHNDMTSPITQANSIACNLEAMMS